LRYFVRSYVTKPTTINAITEIPAKTPRPIGSTDNFLPGRVNAAAADVDAEAAAADPEARAAEEVSEAEATASGAAVAVVPAAVSVGDTDVVGLETVDVPLNKFE
jgi:hypothetical protein